MLMKDERRHKVFQVWICQNDFMTKTRELHNKPSWVCLKMSDCFEGLYTDGVTTHFGILVSPKPVAIRIAEELNPIYDVSIILVKFKANTDWITWIEMEYLYNKWRMNAIFLYFTTTTSWRGLRTCVLSSRGRHVCIIYSQTTSSPQRLNVLWVKAVFDSVMVGYFQCFNTFVDHQL